MGDLPRSFFSSPENAGHWMAHDGPDHDVVVSSRIRLARNVSNFPVKARLSEERAKELEGHLKSPLLALEVARDQTYTSPEGLHDLDRELLFERHLISMELARGSGPR